MTESTAEPWRPHYADDPAEIKRIVDSRGAGAMEEMKGLEVTWQGEVAGKGDVDNQRQVIEIRFRYGHGAGIFVAWLKFDDIRDLQREKVVQVRGVVEYVGKGDFRLGVVRRVS